MKLLTSANAEQMKAAKEPVTRGAVPRVTAVQIVCGDCAGDARLPEKTLLTSAGTCSRCGGRNHVLAATLCGALARHLTNHILTEKGDDTP